MIQPVKLFSVFAPKQNTQSNKNIQPQYHINFATKPDTFERTIPQTKVQAPAYVPFTGYTNDGPIRALGNIICPCCGVEMMTQKQMNAVSKGLGATSEQAVKTLNNYEKYMHPVEKECFNMLKDWSKDKPNSNFKELLQENKEPQLAKLQAKQNTILNTVDELSKQLSEKEQEEVKKVTDTTRMLVSSTDKEIKFKRKTFLKDVEELQSKISNKEVHEKMVKEANKMPTSQNDVSAFVVKYSERGHKEIGERLVKLSVGTIEHIKPRSEGGKNQIGNYMLECGGCNHERSSIPLGDWVDSHPEMKENTQKYIDEVINRINNGDMKGFSFYPIAVARTLFEQSDGKLDVKVEGLKAEE
ncbi:hypothetical protein IJ843_05925 [bacterium]|nr:hypothetical protein [bacterium]